MPRRGSRVRISSSAPFTTRQKTQKYASFVICIRRHSQVVRQRSAKPLFPSSNLGVASNLICRGGGTGRRTGLKIPRIVISVPVRFRSSAPVQKITPVSRGFFLSKIKIKKGIPKAFVEINMQRCN